MFHIKSVTKVGKKQEQPIFSDWPSIVVKNLSVLLWDPLRIFPILYWKLCLKSPFKFFDDGKALPYQFGLATISGFQDHSRVTQIHIDRNQLVNIY